MSHERRMASSVHRGQWWFEQQKYQRAFEKLEPLARKNDPDAQYAIGYMYFYGDGVLENKARAEIWIARAAAQGHHLAMKAMKEFDRHHKKG